MAPSTRSWIARGRAAAARRWADPVERLALVGLAAVLVAFLALAGLTAATVPGFAPPDETSHVGHALTVGEGHLPTLDTTTPDDVPGMQLQFPTRQRIYTANHPPLYYALVAVPLRLGVAADHPQDGFLLARLTTALLTASGGVAAWWMARTLRPARPELAVLAAGLTLLLPAVPHFSGFVHNDGFGLAACGWALAVAVRMLVRGPSRALLVASGASATAAALSRVVGIGAAVVVVSTAGLAWYLHHDGDRGARLRGALARAGAVAAAPVVLAGWFWWRNQRLYGDVAGSASNLERFGYARRVSTIEALTQVEQPVALHRQLWGRFGDSVELANGGAAVPGAILLGLVVLGGVVLAVQALRRSRQPDRATGDDRGGHLTPPERGLGVVWGVRSAWALLASWTLVVLVSVLQYWAAGGGLHGRYLFPALPAAAVLAATALDALPGRRWAVVPAATLALLVGVGLIWAARFAAELRSAPDGWLEVIGFAARGNNVPAGLAWGAGLVALAAGLVAVTAVVRLAGTVARRA